MAIVEIKLSKVKDILEMSLTVPNYQRPYKWQAQHVNQLLDDIIYHRNKNNYRLGTIVLYQNNSQLEIVDGQQRLLTLTLLCSLLDNKNLLCNPKLRNHRFSFPPTIRNLKHNTAVIDSRIKQLSESDQKELIDFLRTYAE